MSDRIEAALAKARGRLLDEMLAEGYWEGHLSSSALATATAVSALSLAALPEDRRLIAAGVRWLTETQNSDSGWGDTTDSPSNLATTLLATAALKFARPIGDDEPNPAEALTRANDYVARHAGRAQDDVIAAAVRQAYGEDRTFAVPILVSCALAGMVPWEAIPPLPFELAALPRSWYRALRLHVVSYALPALVGVGMLLHRMNPPRSPIARGMRSAATGPALRRLAAVQPANGGFLEATPLTSFVTMSLVPVVGPRHPVVERCLRFIRASMRRDGSWPIDTNLSVWVTTNAVSALAASGGVPEQVARRVRPWLLDRQYRRPHPFTGAAPGGWGWTHLEGGVPDADDTSGALLALAALRGQGADGEALNAFMRGARWLVGLRNADGGWPTFCRGWCKLPFDQSCPDITAHALMALSAVGEMADHPSLARLAQINIQRMVPAPMRYLQREQCADGSWLPLWFGNQYAPRHENPVLGTARVLQALARLQPEGEMAARGIGYLLSAQAADGGWGGAEAVTPTVEETARAVIGLSGWSAREDVAQAIERGAGWLADHVLEDRWTEASPIGLYFARLWYAESMYPMAWTVEALGHVAGANL